MSYKQNSGIFGLRPPLPWQQAIYCSGPKGPNPVKMQVPFSWFSTIFCMLKLGERHKGQGHLKVNMSLPSFRKWQKSLLQSTRMQNAFHLFSVIFIKQNNLRPISVEIKNKISCNAYTRSCKGQPKVTCFQNFDFLWFSAIFKPML